MVTLKAHNILDYIIAIVLVASPFVFDFSNVDQARNLFLTLGVGLALYSAITNYYYSLARVIPLGVHMVFDAAAGIVLIAGPSLFGYRDQLSDFQVGVHIVLGLGAVGLVAITRTRTEAAKTSEQRREIDQLHSRHVTSPRI